MGDRAFVPYGLPEATPVLSALSHLAVANARAAIAALDSTARQLPNPRLLRRPTLRREAQSTSALEGTYAPLSEVLTADDETPQTLNLREILNYVATAEQAFDWLDGGGQLSVALLCQLQGRLVRSTPAEVSGSGDVRNIQVVVGQRPDASPTDVPVKAARFVPPPPGDDLRAHVQDLVAWMRVDRSQDVDPVVAAAMSHYQFETIHPFHDGNGRLGRLLVVLYLYASGALSEPTLTVSPWFESRRVQYYDRLLAVSTRGDWDGWVQFFATGIRESADLTHRQMLALVSVQEGLKAEVRSSRLRADSAHTVVDYAVAHPTFSVRGLQKDLGLSYGRANAVVRQLVELGVLAPLGDRAYNRRFHAPKVLAVLVDQ